MFELFEVTEPIKDMVLRKASSSELKKQAVVEGMMTLRQSGVRKVQSGVTTAEEILRLSDKDVV